MNEELYPELYEMEQRHWWFTAKHTIVASLLRRFLGRSSEDARQRVADLGCGCGMILQKLSSTYDVIGADGSDQAVAFCAQRGVKAVIGRFPDDIPLERNTYDAVLLLDVLEHLDDDLASAKTAASLLKPGGILVCTVPAYQWLWTKRDEHHQHKRRYSKRQFRRLFEMPGLKLELLSYMNTALLPLAVVERLMRKIFPIGAGQTDLRVPVAPINAAMRTTFASERLLLGRVWMPAGLSLVAVARKQAD
jgi:SAM-dependent methyltransferase